MSMLAAHSKYHDVSTSIGCGIDVVGTLERASASCLVTATNVGTTNRGTFVQY